MNWRFTKKEGSRKWHEAKVSSSHCQVWFCQFMVKTAFTLNFIWCSRSSSSSTCPTNLWWPVTAETPGCLSFIYRLALNFTVCFFKLFIKILCAWVLSPRPGYEFHRGKQLWHNYSEFPVSKHGALHLLEPLFLFNNMLEDSPLPSSEIKRSTG